MRVYKFRCGRCGYVSRDFEDAKECRKIKEYHEKACGTPAIWTAKREKPKPPVTEIIYV